MVKGFSKVNKWTSEEEDFLETCFNYTIYRGSHGNRINEIVEAMNKAGYKRTRPSIARKLFRLDLTSFSIKNEPMRKHICKDCGLEYKRRKRYKSTYCDRCKGKHKNDNYKRVKEYLHKYYVENKNKDFLNRGI